MRALMFCLALAAAMALTGCIIAPPDGGQGDGGYWHHQHRYYGGYGY